MRIGGVGIKRDPNNTYQNIPDCENRAAVSGGKNGGQTFYSHIVIDKVNYTMQINDVLSINPVFFKAVTTENKYPFLLTQNETGEVNRVRNLDLIKEVLLSDEFTLTDDEKTKLKQKLGI